MTPLRLRRISGDTAKASRALGLGVQMGFSSGNEHGVLSLQPALQADAASTGVYLRCCAGLLQLTEASAVLSLFGEAPVVVEGSLQDWYWQYVNQMLSRELADVFAPLSSSVDPEQALIDPQQLRLTIRLGEESVHARLNIGAKSLLQLLDVGHWHPLQRPLPGDWAIPSPLLLAEMTLNTDELASLRVGDVLLPSRCLFDSAGNGLFQLAGKHWRVATETQDNRLFMQLIQEENLHDEQP